MERTAWRWFPHFLALGMAVVFAINAWMVVEAMSSFPGAAGKDGFDLSNHYDQILSAAEQQAALGWQLDAALDDSRRPELQLFDRTAAPIDGALIEAHAERPVGPVESTPLTFHALGHGAYQSDTTLFSGQWTILMTVHAGGKVITTTRRVVSR